MKILHRPICAENKIRGQVSLSRELDLVFVVGFPVTIHKSAPSLGRIDRGPVATLVSLHMTRPEERSAHHPCVPDLMLPDTGRAIAPRLVFLTRLRGFG